LTVRVLFVATSFPLYEDHWSGTFVAVQARALSRLGCEMTVLAPRGPNAAAHERLGPLDVHRFAYLPRPLERLAYGGGIPANLRASPWLWAAVPPFVASLSAAVSRHAATADIVHAHWTFAGAVCASLPFRKTKPLVVSLHGSDLAQANGLYARAARRVFARADAIVVHSSEMRERALAAGASPERLLQIAHGVEVDLFWRASEVRETTRLLAVGRLSHEKGFDVLLDALRQIPPTAKWELEIVGEGPLRAELARQAEASGLRRVRFLGGLPPTQLRERLAAADVLVVPSRREGFGVVALEGMAAQLPVIATTVGALPEIITPNETGLLAPPDDAPALRDALLSLLHDRARARTLGEHGRRVVEDRYSARVVNEPLAQLYQRLLPPKSARTV
jgi:glycosyltransferase involved in cell wall biosynthesis